MAGHDQRDRHLRDLAAEMAAREVRAELITSGSAPRLRVEVPSLLGGFDDAAFEDNILAAPGPDGRWWYWWPWIQPIKPADDPGLAAEYLIWAMGMAGGPGEDDADDLAVTQGTPGEGHHAGSG